VLPYPDVREATEWLCRVFGFVERLRIAAHRAQLRIGDDGDIFSQTIADTHPNEWGGPDVVLL